ncbi:MAG: proprotein convertase P-domain-containing protein [Myxococcales bacterium]|nr:proprotein convertase P-domain-containing protein [Myxococcales bacterium]
MATHRDSRALLRSLPSPSWMIRVLAMTGLALASGCADDIPEVPDPTDGSTGEPTTTGTPPGDSSSDGADSTGTGGQCGDGVIDGGEDCDGVELGGADCESQGYLAGTLACADDCSFDTSMCTATICGDGVIDDGEECDGMELGGADCASQGYDGGTLACASDCSFDTDACTMTSCGDGMIGGREVCDGADLGGQDCALQGFDGGTLACEAGCRSYDVSGCYACGDDLIGGPEVCDGADLGGQDCALQGYDGGTLACALDCSGYDVSGCYACGDGVVGGPEACDGMDLGGQDCAGLGFLGGTLACDASCSFDTTGCNTFCSTPALPIGPDGDTTTVDSIVIPGGGGYVTDLDVILEANHTFVGDLIIELHHLDSGTSEVLQDSICGTAEDIAATYDQDAAAPPDCVVPIAVEGDVLPEGNLDHWVGLPDAGGTWELTITDQFFGDGGTLDQWCVRVQTDVLDPSMCGDGLVTYGEQCDGMSLDGAVCEDTGWLGGGVLGCDGSCLFDTTGCLGPQCGDSAITAPEESCDTNEIAGQRCEDFGFVGGSLSCSFPGCGVDLDECSNEVIAVCASPGAAVGSVMATVSSTVTLMGPGLVADVDVFLDVTHPYTSDLDVFLVHDASGTMVELTTDQCIAGDDVFAFFNDEAAGPPDCQLPVSIEGSIRPEGVLSAMDGLALAGDWTLQVTDDYTPLDDGVFNEWCIYVRPL